MDDARAPPRPRMGRRPGPPPGPGRESSGRTLMRKDVKRRRARREVKAIILTLLYLLGITNLALNYSSELLFYTAHEAANVLSQADPCQDDWTDVETISDMYEFLQQTFVPAVWTAKSFDGINREPGTLLGRANVFVGPIRFGIIRVIEQDCPDAPAFKNSESWKCYLQYSDETLNVSSHAGIPWRFNESSSEPGEWTTLGYHYPPPGLFKLLDPFSTKEQASAAINELQQNQFVDEATRAIFIDTVLFNKNFNHVILIRLIAEALTSGGLVPHVETRLVEPTLFHSGQDVMLMVVQALILIQTVYYLCLEFFRIYSGCKNVNIGRGGAVTSQRWKYFQSPVSVLALIGYITIFISICYRAAAIVELPEDNSIDVRSPTFINFFSAERMDAAAVRIFAIGQYLVWIRLLAHISIAPQFALLTRTMAKAWRSIYSFSIMLGIVFFASSLSHMVVFSTDVFEYRTLEQTFYAQMLSLLGEGTDFQKLYQLSPVVAPVLFMSFAVVATLIMLNLFVGIISTAYEVVTEEIKDEPERPIVKQIVEYLWSIVEMLPLVGHVAKKRLLLLEAAQRKARVLEMNITKNTRRSSSVSTSRPRRTQQMGRRNPLTAATGTGAGAGVGAGSESPPLPQDSPSPPPPPDL